MPSPPQSPPLAAKEYAATMRNAMRNDQARRGGAAYTITGECERLFCETLRAVFLGERNMALQDSLVMGVHNQYNHDIAISAGENNRNDSINTDGTGNDYEYANDYGMPVGDAVRGQTVHSHSRFPARLSASQSGLPSPEMDAHDLDGYEAGSDHVFEDVFEEDHSIVQTWIEVWDYVGGNRFRGFVAEKDGERAMFVFFDRDMVGGDLKAGLMALLELCDVEYFSCTRLVACLDRHTDSIPMDALAKDLGWIGFQLTTLIEFSDGDEFTSERWLFMDMDV